MRALNIRDYFYFDRVDEIIDCVRTSFIEM